MWTRWICCEDAPFCLADPFRLRRLLADRASTPASVPCPVVGRVRHEYSAGGVVLRVSAGSIEVLLIKPAGRNRWQLPKGLVEPGERPDMTAVREVREETGVCAAVVAPLPPVRFFYQMSGDRISKRVDFFVMQYQSGSEQDHDYEVDEARWFARDEALSAITFDTERSTVEAALQLFRKEKP